MNIRNNCTQHVRCGMYPKSHLRLLFGVSTAIVHLVFAVANDCRDSYQVKSHMVQKNELHDQ